YEFLFAIVPALIDRPLRRSVQLHIANHPFVIIPRLFKELAVAKIGVALYRFLKRIKQTLERARILRDILPEIISILRVAVVHEKVTEVIVTRNVILQRTIPDLHP